MDGESLREIGDSILKKDGTTVIQSFLDAGLDINALDSDGITMLSFAVECDNIEVIEFLVQNGADANIANLDGSKPIHLAALYDYKDIVKFFINTGIDIECRTSYGMTILDHAIKGGHLDIVKYLVSNKCSIVAKKICGKTPLYSAVAYKHSDIVEYLIECGAGLDSHDEDGFGLLHLACLLEESDIVKILLKNGWDPNCQYNFRKDSPLHVACSWDTIENVEVLINAGADFNIKNVNDETPLCILIRSPLCLKGISLFLENGAYFQPNDFNFITSKPSLKDGILKDVKLCTQSLVNKFNFFDLPKVYEIPELAQRLPRIEKMKIPCHSNGVQNIAECVTYEIQTKGYCNILNIHPIFLYSLCVRSLIQHYGD